MTSGSILRGTWALLRANPAAIAVWGVLYLTVNLVVQFAIRPMMRAQMAAAHAGAPAFPPIGPFLLMWVLLVALFIVLAAAIWRAVLFPERARAFYLRLGRDEARLLGLLLAAFVALIAIEVVVVIAAMVLALVFRLTIGSVQGGAGGALLVLAFALVVIWAQVRLSLIGPLTIARERIAVEEGWRLAGGRFWPLFGAYLVIWLVVIAVSLTVMLPQILAAAALMRNPTDPAAQAALARIQAGQLGMAATPGGLLLLVIGAIVGVVILVALAAAPAVATAQLIEERAGLR